MSDRMTDEQLGRAIREIVQHARAAEIDAAIGAAARSLVHEDDLRSAGFSRSTITEVLLPHMTDRECEGGATCASPAACRCRASADAAAAAILPFINPPLLAEALRRGEAAIPRRPGNDKG